MRDVIYVKLDIVYSINHQLNETISQKSYFLKLQSKVIILLFETVKLSVSLSPRNLYNSLKSINESKMFYVLSPYETFCKIVLSGPHAPEMYCIAQLAPKFNTLEAV